MLSNNIINPRNYNINFPHKEIIVDHNIFINFFDIIKKLELGSNFTIITDEKIYKKVIKFFPEIASLKNFIILPQACKAEYEQAVILSKKIHYDNYVIAIGSGTINDLVKYASYLVQRPYIIFATAPSMNGYLSANSSLSQNGLKQSFCAHPPIAAYFDIDILAAAPLRLIKSGLGDSLASNTIRTDWLLAKHVFNTVYSDLPFDMVYDLEKELFAYPEKLLERDPKYIAILTKILVLSGLAMIHAGSSMPASQGEHLIAHLYAILDKTNIVKTFHGEQIAVCSLYMSKLQETILAYKAAPKLKLKELNIASLKALPRSIQVHSYQETSKKYAGNIADIEQKLANIWSDFKQEIAQKPYCLSSKELYQIIVKANLATDYKALRWREEKFTLATENALFIRDRFTFLDLDLA